MQKENFQNLIFIMVILEQQKGYDLTSFRKEFRKDSTFHQGTTCKSFVLLLSQFVCNQCRCTPLAHQKSTSRSQPNALTAGSAERVLEIEWHCDRGKMIKWLAN